MNERDMFEIEVEAASKAYRAAYLATAIKCSVALISFTALAIFFNHWWIALFALFFTSSTTTKKKGE